MNFSIEKLQEERDYWKYRARAAEAQLELICFKGGRAFSDVLGKKEESEEDKCLEQLSRDERLIGAAVEALEEEAGL